MRTQPQPAQRPLIGLIVPPASGTLPPECPALYGDRADFAVLGLGLDRMAPDGYERVIGLVEQAARELAGRGAAAIALMGTSLSFYRGAAFNRRLAATLHDATGLPATTMSDAVLDALHAVGARRVVVGTAYTDTVNQLLRDFLADCGIAVAGLAALDLEAVEDVLAVGDDDLLDLARRAAASAPGADALLISCGGLQTLGVTRPLEEELGLPVVSSAVAGAWAAVRLAGVGGAVPDHGRLLAID